ELGIAYWVESTAVKGRPGSPAQAAGLEDNDEIREGSVREPGGKLASPEKWGPRGKLSSQRGKDDEGYEQWAHLFWALQRSEYPELKVKVFRAGKTLELGPMTAEPDESWPLVYRGLTFRSDTRKQKADTLVEALRFGIDSTADSIRQIYLTLLRMFSRRISTKTLGGPIMIAQQSFFAAEDPATFVLIMGIISINLAVVTFLPIPVLDGGHMVFLVYEKLRGRPPPEAVRAVAVYVGLAIILFLMVFVFWLDIKRIFF